MDEQAREIREAYDRVFSDESVVQEQLDTAAWLEGSGKDEGQVSGKVRKGSVYWV